MTASKRSIPSNETGILLTEPTRAYVVAEVEPTHQSDARFRKKPMDPATRLTEINDQEKTTAVLLDSTPNSPKARDTGKRRGMDRR